MTVEAMIAAQTRIETQESPNVESLPDGHAANVPGDVNGTLGFNQMRFGWMYGTPDDGVSGAREHEPEQENRDAFAGDANRMRNEAIASRWA